MPHAPSGRRASPQARGGKSDNLQRISGIGPKNERTLHSLGFFHFDQIAGWSDEEVAWVDNHLKFNGRIIREEWILQAGLLAEGKEDEFERLYGSGRRKHGSARPQLDARRLDRQVTLDLGFAEIARHSRRRQSRRGR